MGQRQVVALGAGELLITSIDQEGTGKGFDVELIRKISDLVHIPVIACGGAGESDHVFDVVHHGNANAVCIASMLHYSVLEHLETNDDFSSEGNIEYLKTKRPYANFRETSIRHIKRYFKNSIVSVRFGIDQ